MLYKAVSNVIAGTLIVVNPLLASVFNVYCHIAISNCNNSPRMDDERVPQICGIRLNSPHPCISINST